MKKNFLYVVISALVLGSILLSACAQATPTEAPATEAATEAPTAAPTEAPMADLGTAENPIVIAPAVSYC